MLEVLNEGKAFYRRANPTFKGIEIILATPICFSCKMN